jgi:hypothetical protein
MRTQVFDYVSGLDLGGFYLSNELPWSESGTPLYTKNLKRIYVDVTNYGVEPLINTLSGINIQNQVISVRVYLASDAKTVPPNYDDLITDLLKVNLIAGIDGANRREVDIETSIDNDVLTTELEYRFYKLLT